MTLDLILGVSCLAALILAAHLDRQLHRERLRRQVAEARLELVDARTRAGRVLRVVEGGAR